MLRPRQSLLVSGLVDPARLRSLSDSQWDLLIRQARRANLVGVLSHLLSTHNLRDSAPVAARAHLDSADALARRQEASVRWEVKCILDAVANLEGPVILLKGAAYVIAKLPAAVGRIFSDVDILVSRESLPAVESQLLIHGWRNTHHSPYDQRYYRRWTHELPPMQHMRRGTVVDVHHAILPPTARVVAQSHLMRDAAIKVSDYPALSVLSPADMVIHSACHLFHEGELDNGLRDLVDIDRLLRHFANDPSFWTALTARADEVGLSRSLYYALHFAKAILQTPVPAQATQAVESTGRPFFPVASLMDFCFQRGLAPNHASCADRWTPVARRILYLRSHWLRMPLPLLTYHIARKYLFPAREAA